VIGLPLRVRLPVAFVPPVVAVPAANAIVPFALPSAVGGASVAGPAAAVGALAAAVAAVVGSPLLAAAVGGLAVGALAGAALFGLAQLWGYLGGRKAPAILPSPDLGASTFTGSYSPTATTTITYVGVINFLRSSGGSCVADQTLPNAPYSRTLTGFAGFQTTRTGTHPCGGSQSLSIQALDAAGVPREIGINTGVTSLRGYLDVDGQFDFTSTAPDARPALELAGEPQPLPPRTALTFQPLPEPLQPLKPLPLPLADPAQQPQPETEPQIAPVEPGPSRPAVPGIAPVTPKVAPPWLLPGTPLAPQQTTPDGNLAPTPRAPAVATAPDAITPYPGAPPLVGNGPAPNLQEMAKELGRLESKMDALLKSPIGPGGDATDWFQLLREPLIAWLQSFFDGAPAHTWELYGPCEVDENGDPITPPEPRLVDIPETSSDRDAVLARLDGLAELIQQHKYLRQPTCTRKAPTGEFVTVNFEQIQ